MKYVVTTLHGVFVMEYAVQSHDEAWDLAKDLYVKKVWLRGTYWKSDDGTDAFRVTPPDTDGEVLFTHDAIFLEPPDAPELARLRDENAKLRETLKRLLAVCEHPDEWFKIVRMLDDGNLQECIMNARELLEAKP